MSIPKNIRPPLIVKDKTLIIDFLECNNIFKN